MRFRVSTCYGGQQTIVQRRVLQSCAAFFFFIFTYSLRNSGVLSIEINLLSCELCQFFRIVCLSITFEPDKLDDRVAGIVWGPAGLVKVA